MNRWIGVWLAGLFVMAVGAAAQPATPDYKEYEVLGVQELDLFAGPANSAAHLAPDGTQFAHFQSGTLCFYSLEAGIWAEDRCFPLDTDAFDGSREDVNWSPDGRYLTAPTFQRALVFLEDTDIQLLDVQSGAVLNLTDDGVEGSVMFEEEAGTLDLAPVWLDESTLQFIRYAPTPGTQAGDSFLQSLSGAIYQIDVRSGRAGGEAERVGELPAAGPFRSYLLASDPATRAAAVNVESRDSAGFTYSIWQRAAAAGSFALLASPGSEGTRYLGYSANGEWLMALQPNRATGGASLALVDTITGKVVGPDLASRDFVEPEVMAAGWSPTGDALAYIVRDTGNPDASGLYIAPAPGEPGRLILPGELYGTTCCMGMPIRWAENDVIMIGRGAEPGVLLVKVGP